MPKPRKMYRHTIRPGENGSNIGMVSVETSAYWVEKGKTDKRIYVRIPSYGHLTGDEAEEFALAILVELKRQKEFEETENEL
jgi:hypothetical protein